MTELHINQQELARVLQQIFSEGGESYDSRMLEQLALLNCPTLSLRMRPALLKQLEGDDSFDLQRFVVNTLKCFRTQYLRLQAEMAATKSPATRDARIVDEYNEVVFELGNLVDAVVPYSYLAEDEIDMYLDSDDTYLNSFGARMVDAIPAASLRYVEQILSTMGRNDVQPGAFGIAPSLARHLDESPDAYDVVYDRFDAGNDMVQANIIQAFPEVARALPLRAQQLILQAALRGEKSNERLLNLAVIALAECHVLRTEAIAILSRQLHSTVWYIRGNAAVSLAKLDIEDMQLIEQIGGLVFDSEGNDWSVCSAALTALSTLGSKASCAIGDLLALAATEIDVEDFNGYPCINAMLADAFGAIGVGSTEVIEALRKIVEKQGYISASPATFALGLFGELAMPALGTIEAYLFGDAQPGDTEESAAELVDVLVAIAGTSHPVVGTFIERLKLSPFDDVVMFANAYSSVTVH